MKKRLPLANMRVTTRLIACGFLVFGLFQALSHQQTLAEWVSARVRKPVKAALTGATLNNGTGNVVSGFDISSQTTALSPDIGAYRWTVNGSNFMALNMPFNSGPSQTDFSGRGNTGAVSGGAIYNASGRVGGAMPFDGADDVITGTTTGFPVASSDRTISLWVYGANLAQGNRMLFGYGSAASNQMSSLIIGYADVSDRSYAFWGYNNDLVGTSILSDNTWNHIVFTLASNVGTLYLNGNPDGTKVFVGLNTPSSTNYYVGDFTSVMNNLNASLDEIQVYPRALSAQQVTQLYQDGLASLGGPTIIQAEETVVGQVWDLSITPITSSGTVGSAIESSNPVLITSGTPTITGTLDNPDEGAPIISTLTIPVGSTAGYRWTNGGVNYMALNIPFNSGASLVDVGGYGNTGTAINSPTFTTSGCSVGNCLTFDGVNDRIEIADASSLDITNAITIETWLNFPASAVKELIDKNNNSNTGPGAYQIFQNNQNISFRLVKSAGLNTMTSATALSLNTWYHVAATWDGVTMKLFINGVQDSTTLALAAPIDTTTGKLVIGAYTDNQFAYSGKMDEVHIYPYALSAAQIVQNYQDGLGAIGGPTRISALEHANGQTWDLIATEFVSAGTVGEANYIDSATIVAAASTTPGIITPSGTQTTSVTIQYSCADTTSLLRDFLVEYSTNGGASYANATLVSTSSGSVAGSLLSMVACNSGTSSNSFVWNSLVDSVAGGFLDSDVRIRITAQYPSGPFAETGNFSVQNAVINTFTSPTTISSVNTDYENEHVVCSGTTLTVNGTHTFASLTLQNNCTLTQTATSTVALNRTILTVTGATDIRSGSTINMNATGYPNGYTAGVAGAPTTTGGATGNSGGSHGGQGYPVGGSAGVTYDSVFAPLYPGAGAANSSVGGGYLQLTTGSLNLVGTITANAAAGGGGANTGAGGGVFLTVTGALTGTGTVTANGGNGAINDFHGFGGGGRISLLYSSAVSGNPSVSTLASRLQTYGGSTGGGTLRGAAGTVYIEDTSVRTANDGDVFVNNNNTVSVLFTPLTGSAGSLTIQNRGAVVADTIVFSRDLTLTGTSTLTHSATTTVTTYRLNATVGGLTSVDATSSINLSARGYPNGYTADGSGNPTTTGAATGNSGGSHGGFGYPVSGTAGSPYDSIFQPLHPGAGAANSSVGGGYVKLTTGSLSLAGTINTNAAAATGGANTGAGGGVWLTVTGATSVTGTISANGGSGTANNFHGIGSGGRIAFYYNANVPGNPSTATLANQLQAWSGTGSGGTLYGAAGTVYIEDTSTHTANDGIVIVNNNNLATSMFTTPSSPLGELQIKNRAVVRFATFVVNRDLIITNNSTLTHDTTTTSTTYRLDGTIGGLLSIDATSSVNVQGKGYPNGYTADGSGNPTTTGAATGNSGGSHGGFGYPVSGTAGSPYDSIFQPLHPGAGAANSSVGGGYVKLTTGSLSLAGTINTNAATASGGANTGAGGGVWLTVTGATSVTGTISANGGSGTVNNSHGIGSGGRIAFYYNTSVPGNPSTATLANQLQAWSGTGGGGTLYGAAGTVYIEDTSTHTANDGIVIVNNNNLATAMFTTPSSPLGELQVKNRAVVRFGTFVVNRDLIVTGTSTLTHDTTTTSTTYRFIGTIGGLFSVDGTSSVNVFAKGYPNGYTADVSGNPTTVGAATGNSGGTHGGFAAAVSGVTGTPYGNIFQPLHPGAGSGNSVSGGGYVKITTDDFTLAGTINASAAAASGGANTGAGGGIWITATGDVSVTGTISANGGSGTVNNSHGIGSGGRIAFYYNSSVGSNPIPSTLKAQMQAYGGAPSGGTLYAAAGTIYIEDSAQHASGQGTLIVDNNNQNASTRRTPLFVVGQGYTTVTLDDLYVNRFGNLVIDTPCAGTPALTVNGFTDLSNNGAITNNQSGTCTVSQGVINISTTTLPAGLLSSPYSRTVESGGGYGPHTFVCRNGGVTVACTTVLPAGLDMSSGGVISGTPTLAGTSVFTVRATEASPGVGFDEQVLSLTIGNAPIQPTNLFSNSTDAQSCCSSAQMIDASPVFSAVFNDTDAGDTASKYRIQVDDTSDLSSPIWDSGANGTTVVGVCNNLSRCANISYAGPALSLTGATYYWRIKYWDSLGFEGAFSSIVDFTTDIAPLAPTTLFSNDSNAQTGLTNPVGILAANPVFSAIFNDPDVGDTATKYRVQVSTTNNFSAIIWDSGSGGTNMSTCNEGARCSDIIFGGTALTRNEATYYWRIKFWDAAGVEGAWSQDPTSTNTFKMGAAGGSVQILQQQQQAPQPTVPDAPIAGAVEVLGPNSVRYNWIDVSANELGFRILNAEGQVIATTSAGQTSVVESSLPANTVVEGRKVVAYNSIGQSSASAFAAVRTAAPQVQPTVQQRGGDSVTFVIEPAFTIQSGQTSAFPGQTAVRFDLIVTNQQGETRTISSDWVQSNSFTFTGIAPDEEIQVRVVTRNQEGLQNEPSTFAEIGTLSRRFVVSMGVFKKGTETLPRPMIATDIISVRMQMTSVGTDAANSVTLNMPLPRYIRYVPGSLIVDGRAGSDAPGDQGTLANQNGVSASWATINPGDSHMVAFELAFDIEDLRGLRDTALIIDGSELTAEETSIADVVAAIVTATANPLIQLQASVSFADSDAVYMSPVITLEPDVETAVEPVIEEVPVDETPIEEQPVQVPTPEETQIIEQILQQEFPAPTPTPQPGQPAPEPSPAPTLQTGETTSNSDAGSFNLVVTGENGKLGLTGSANVSGESIQFTGTTTEPFTVITLIFNDSITAIAVSDANGFWQTFVDADRLGILPGQEAVVKVEAIAAKGDLRSERVSVGDVVISRSRSGDIAADFETTVSDSPIVTVLQEIEHQVVKVVEEQEPVIKATLTVSAPVVIVSSAPLWGYLPYAPTLIYHFISWLIGFVGRKRKGTDQATFGVVYDAITKLPLALAIVRIYNQADNKLVSTIVTDKLGRYDALLAPGHYRLEVAKPQYQYPSGIVTSSVDGIFDRIYDKHSGFAVTETGTVLPHVPVDPINSQRQWQLSFGIKKLWLAFQRAGNLLATPIILVGFIMSVALLYAVPSKPSNWIIAGLYAVTLAIQFKLKPKLMKAWGVVYDMANDAILPLVTIQLIEPATSKVAASRLTDYEGRFTFLPEPGEYVLKANKPGYEQVTEVVQGYGDRQPIPGEIRIDKPNQRISGDVAMKQV